MQVREGKKDKSLIPTRVKNTTNRRSQLLEQHNKNLTKNFEKGSKTKKKKKEKESKSKYLTIVVEAEGERVELVVQIWLMTRFPKLAIP